MRSLAVATIAAYCGTGRSFTHSHLTRLISSTDRNLCGPNAFQSTPDTMDPSSTVFRRSTVSSAYLGTRMGTSWGSSPLLMLLERESSSPLHLDSLLADRSGRTRRLRSTVRILTQHPFASPRRLDWRQVRSKDLYGYVLTRHILHPLATSIKLSSLPIRHTSHRRATHHHRCDRPNVYQRR